MQVSNSNRLDVGKKDEMNKSTIFIAWIPNYTDVDANNIL